MLRSLVGSEMCIRDRISVDQPDDGNFGEYHLSRKVRHPLSKLCPLGSVPASFEKCPYLQPRSELLQEHLSSSGINNSPSSSNCMKPPYGSHAYSSKCKGGTSTPGKSRTRQAPVSLEVPTPLRTGNILHMREISRAKQRLPTSRAKPCPIRLQG